MGIGKDAGIEAISTRGFDGEDMRLPARPAEAFNALHQTVKQTATTHAADDAVNGNIKLVPQLANDGSRAIPNVRMVKRRDIEAARVLGEEVLAEEEISSSQVLADLEDAGAEIKKLILEDLGGRLGDDDGGGFAEGGGRAGASEASVAAGEAVEVDVGVGCDGVDHEVAYAAGFEGAAGLEVVEFEIDVAVGGDVGQLKNMYIMDWIASLES